MVDAVLALPRTRSMYVRRLRTLMDGYTNGRLEVGRSDMPWCVCGGRVVARAPLTGGSQMATRR